MNQSTAEKLDNEIMTFKVSDQILGIPVQQVQEILPLQTVTRVPLAPPFLHGLLNLRGQIVTVIDLRRRLQIEPKKDLKGSMNIIVNQGLELFSLLVDGVGDVISVEKSNFSPPPATLDECWKNCCKGVFRLKENLLILVDTAAIINIDSKS